MYLQFSESGPRFPVELVDQMIRGEVVFLCGAGISMPRLPGFRALVDNCYQQLGLCPTDGEQEAIDNYRFEEALGALQRRLVEPANLIAAVSKALTADEGEGCQLDLFNHNTILRLSKDRSNRPVVVTTNFETLLEKALRRKQKWSKRKIKLISHAGRNLPTPGTSEFAGILHLHGRMRDKELDFLQTPFVLTSSDYGDAYMHSGWAYQFLAELARSKTLVLLGYSAGDAPVRYLLNILEADRERFSDLKPVYALDMAYEGATDIKSRWSALAVDVIAYHHDHSVLWHDLAKLADLVEQPSRERKLLIEQNLLKSPKDLSGREMEFVNWAIREQTRLWDEIPSLVLDPAWFDHFEKAKLWTSYQAASVIANWIAQDWENLDRLEVALNWLHRPEWGFGESFQDQFRRQVERHLFGASALAPLWREIWQIALLTRREASGLGTTSDGLYRLDQRLRRENVSSGTVQEAIRFLSPGLEVSSRRKSPMAMPLVSEIEKPSDLLSFQWRSKDEHYSDRVFSGLKTLPIRQKQLAKLVAEVAVVELSLVVQHAVDLNSISSQFDFLSWQLRSVEEHEQNKHLQGARYLVPLLATYIKQMAKSDPVYAKALSLRLKELPGEVGKRLWLHSLQFKKLYSKKEVLNGLLSLEEKLFWARNPELLKIFEKRFTYKDRDLLKPLVKRVVATAYQYYEQNYVVKDGVEDWRPATGDLQIWLRLTLLLKAKALAPKGKRTLKRLIKARPYLNRPVRESDFFGSYSHGVRAIHGDPEPIQRASGKGRLQIAQSATQSRKTEQKQSWAVYCMIDPAGAYKVIKSVEFSEVNAKLWTQFLDALDRNGELDNVFLSKVLKRICRKTDSEIAKVLGSLCWLIYHKSCELAEFEIYVKRIVTIILKGSSDCPTELGLKDLEHSWSSPAARLMDAFSKRAIYLNQQEKKVPKELRRLHRDLLADNGMVGLHASAMALSGIGAHVQNFADNIEKYVLPRCIESSQVGSSLRYMMLTSGLPSSDAAIMFRSVIKQAALEFECTDDITAESAANCFVSPILVDRQISDVRYQEVAQILRDGDKTLRRGCLVVLKGALEKGRGVGNRDEIWTGKIKPFLEKCWPQDKCLRDRSCSNYLLDILGLLDGRYGEAFSFLQPLLMFEGQQKNGQEMLSTHLGGLIRKRCFVDYPDVSMDLLWTMFKSETINDYHTAEALDILLQAKPDLEKDRRFQALDILCSKSM